MENTFKTQESQYIDEFGLLYTNGVLDSRNDVTESVIAERNYRRLLKEAEQDIKKENLSKSYYSDLKASLLIVAGGSVLITLLSWILSK